MHPELFYKDVFFTVDSLTSHRTMGNTTGAQWGNGI